MPALDGKVIAITGAAGLLGRAFADAVAVAGGRLALADIDDAKGAELEAALNKKFGPGRAFYHRTDITSTESVEGFIGACIEKMGRVDALVNNAYPRNQRYGASFEKVTYADFCENVDMHLGGYFLASQRFAERFASQKAGGVIVSVASIYGVAAPRFEIYEGTAMTMPVEYAVIKSGITHLMKYIARYYKGRGVRANTLSPGGVLAGQPEMFLKRYNAQCTGKGMLEPADISGALVFLLSDDAAYMNGQNLIVDDGFTL